MSFAALALVIVASFLHATWNLLAKQAAAGAASFVCAYNLFACCAYAPPAVWLLAHGAPSGPALGCIVASGIIHLGYGLCLQHGYKVADLSVVYPVARGTGPLLASLGAVLLLGEAPSAHQAIGLAGVVVSIGLIATQGDLSAFRRPAGLAGVSWGTATGGLIAAYTVVDAYAVTRFDVSPLLINWGSNLLQFALLAPAFAKNRAVARVRMRGLWLSAIAVGVLSPLAYILVLTALDWGAPLSAVAPAREVSMMIGALFGMVILREGVGPWRLVGCAVMIASVVLLAGG